MGSPWNVDEDVASVIDVVQEAALGGASWLTALERLAGVTGSHGGQLVGFGAEMTVPFNLVTGPREFAEDFVAVGADPSVNSRVRIGGRAPELTVFDERDFTTAEDMRRHPDYAAFIRRHDIPYVCLAPLLRDEDYLVGLAVCRSGSQGQISDVQRRVFTAIAPHVRSAVRTQIAIENQGAALLTGALEHMSTAVFACDAFTRVRLMTPGAERLVSEGRWLTLRRGVLSSPDPAAAAAIRSAAAAGADAAADPPAPFVVRDPAGAHPILIEVARAPGAHARRFGAATLLIVRQPDNHVTRRALAARALYGLTPAEALVAAQLAGGQSPQAVAAATGVGIGTVRTHIRRIFEKSGLNSQIQLVATLARY